jgi:hypothetical protein
MHLRAFDNLAFSTHGAIVYAGAPLSLAFLIMTCDVLELPLLVAAACRASPLGCRLFPRDKRLLTRP